MSPDRQRALGVAVLFPTTLLAIFVACAAMRPVPAPPPPSPWADEAERLGVTAREIGMGQIAFRNTCAVCHGPEADGIPRLGKPLRNSEFVQSHTDEQLLDLILAGRTPDDPANTTGALMPARGNAPLTEERLATVVTFLRAIQEPGAPTVSLDQWIVDTSSGGQDTAGIVGAGAGVGHQAFINACSACHGANAEGIEGLGKPLATSPFVASKTDEELINFVKTGRPIWDPENTTGVDMPPKGGNPALGDEDLKKIVSYLRALHEQSGAE
jgi:disulfide bond formation protein DsbB